ncbi:MAG: hypothetical protein JNG85_00475 [Spirochaetaceae bacterium]|nr:hypothetical protein [Spirochaetaceae bacterium]
MRYITSILGLAALACGKAFALGGGSPDIPECFVAGTLILMGDGGQRPIETIREGDLVMSYDLGNGRPEPQAATWVKSDWHDGQGDDYTVRLAFADGSSAQCTNHHPYYVVGKGYSSCRPDRSLGEYGLVVGQLAIGDRVLRWEAPGVEETVLSAIEIVREPVRTYNVMQVLKNRNFFANGILVHNSGGDAPPPPAPPESEPDPGTESPPDPPDAPGPESPPETPSGPPPEALALAYIEAQVVGAEAILAEEVALLPLPAPLAIAELSASTTSAAGAAKEAEGRVSAAKTATELALLENKEKLLCLLDAGRAPRIGDPVRPATGSYSHEEADILLRLANLDFSIERRYDSEYPVGKSMGSIWRLNLDSAILRGVDPESERLVEAAVASEKSASALYALALKTYSACFGEPGNHEEVRNRLRGSLQRSDSTARSLAASAAAAADLARSLAPSGGEAARQALALQAKAKAALDRALARRGVTANALSELESARNRLDESGAILLKVRSSLADARERSMASKEARALNARSRASGRTAEWEAIGLGNLCLVDERGLPLVFLPSGPGIYRAVGDRAEREGILAESALGFEHRRRDGLVHRYDHAGLLVGVCDRNGVEIRLERDGEGRAERVLAGSLSLVLTYDARGRLSRVDGPGGKTWRYSYDAAGRLSAFQDPSGHLVAYEYEGDLLTGIVKPDGASRSIRYEVVDGRSVVGATKDESGATERFSYDFSARLARWTDRAGAIREFAYDGRMRTLRETKPNGAWVELAYDEEGNLAERRDQVTLVRYRYDGRGNLLSAHWQDGGFETWTFDARDLETSHRDRDGVVTNYLRDSRGNIVRIERGGKLVMALRRDDRGLPVSIREGGGAAVECEYDADGRLIRRRFGDGTTESLVVDDWGNVLEKVDRDGGRWEFVHDLEDDLVREKGPTGLERVFTYSNRHDLVAVAEKDLLTGRGRRTSYAFDSRHLMVRSVDGTGTETVYRHDGEERLLEKTSAGILSTSYIYDGEGQVTGAFAGIAGEAEGYAERYAYDASGRVTRVVLPLDREIEYSYGSSGSPESVKDPLGGITGLRRSSTGRLLGLTSALGAELRIEYDAAGFPSRSVDGEGIAREYRFDQQGRLESMRDACGSLWSWGYDGEGRINQASLDGKSYRSYERDGLGRLLEVLGADGNPIETWSYANDRRSATRRDGGGIETRFEFDAWGRILREVDGEGRARSFDYDAEGRLLEVRDGYGRAERRDYDALGRLVARIDRSGGKTLYVWNHLGKLTRVETGGSIAWEGRYDAAGRLQWERSYPGTDRNYQYDRGDRIVGFTSAGVTMESLRYEDAGRSVYRRDARGSESRLGLDRNGRVIAEKGRGGAESGYRYDAEGRLLESRSFGGEVAGYEYDPFGRLLAVFGPNGKNQTYRYDAEGRLVEARAPSGRLVFEYDRGGRMVAAFDEAAGERIEYGYDRSGLRAWMKRGGKTLRYAYGLNGELVSLLEEGGATIRFAYDAVDREIRRDFGNGLRIETGYDAAGRVAFIRELQSRSGEILRAAGYVYDKDGRLAAEIDERARVRAYRYDPSGRLAEVVYPSDAGVMESDIEELERLGVKTSGGQLTEAWAPAAGLSEGLDRALKLAVGGRKAIGIGTGMAWFQQYSYDPGGNRLSKTTKAGRIDYAYGPEDELLQAGLSRLRYDEEGKLIERSELASTTRYYYDYGERATGFESIATDGETEKVRYEYDPFGRRAARIQTGRGGSRIVYDGLGLDEALILGLGENAEPEMGKKYEKATATYEGKYRFEGFAASSVRVGEASPTISTNLSVKGLAAAYTTEMDSRYLGHDRLGSVTTVADREGQSIDRIGYDAFGRLVDRRTESASPWTFIGKNYDAASRSCDFGIRDYVPGDGRFTTVDPIRDGTNWYSYCDSDPVNYWDLLGLEQAGYGPRPRVKQNDLRPEKPQGPCNFRSLVAVVEEESGVNFSLPEIRGIAMKLNTAKAMDLEKDYWVYDPIAVVREAAIAAGYPDARIEIGTKRNMSEIGAKYTIRYLDEHIQLGCSDGTLLWEPYRFFNKKTEKKYSGEAEMVRNVWIELNKEKMK